MMLDGKPEIDHRKSAIHSLLEQLTAFTPADAPEALHRARMLELLAAAADPFARSHFTPGHFTASGFVLSPERDAMLLIFHGKFHRWLQPGGHVDPGDVDLCAAARREVLEETGVVVPSTLGSLFDLDIHPIPANPKKGEPPHEHFDVRFLFTAPCRSLTAGSDAKDARWFPLDDISEALTDASVMRAVAKLRAMTEPTSPAAPRSACSP